MKVEIEIPDGEFCFGCLMQNKTREGDWCRYFPNNTELRWVSGGNMKCKECLEMCKAHKQKAD